MKKLMTYALGASCLLSSALALAEQDTLTQMYTHNSLVKRLYDGEFSIKDLKPFGDFGLGTLNSFDAEVVIVDGHYYRVNEDGKAEEAEDDALLPYAAVTDFNADQSFQIPAGLNFAQLGKQIDTHLPTLNGFYAVRIDATFKYVKARVLRHTAPLTKSLEQARNEQAIFEFKNVEGTLVGFRCPSFVKGINTPGYHLHFIAKDGKAGGHIVDLSTDVSTVEVDRLHKFTLMLPENPKAPFNTTEFEPAPATH
ncbi:MAG: alpha-acetolactate decarboxylase [Pseudomonadota bacterium]